MSMRHVQCVIAGGGPAGLMLGYLLARAGVRVIVLEKHADFLRDFRGDTIHPSTMEVIGELGLIEPFLALPHQPVSRLVMRYGSTPYALVDFSSLRVRCPFIAMMPQWDFLNLLAQEAQRFPSFSLLMNAEATSFIEKDGWVMGLVAKTAEGPLSITADLVVAADGRSSILRAQSGLKVRELGAPMDALWFRLPRSPEDTSETQARIEPGLVFIMLNRGDYWQCAFVIGKGSLEKLKSAGLDAFRIRVGRLLPFDAGRTGSIGSWDDVKLLNVEVNRLETWAKPGVLFIGDAAHAMSPIGGVGINLAIQDAVATANMIARPLLAGTLSLQDLRAVQRRRHFPARMTQAMQVAVQNNLIALALEGQELPPPPLPMRLLARYPWLRRIPARIIGLGIRPEHVSQFIRDAA